MCSLQRLGRGRLIGMRARGGGGFVLRLLFTFVCYGFSQVIGTLRTNGSRYVRTWQWNEFNWRGDRPVVRRIQVRFFTDETFECRSGSWGMINEAVVLRISQGEVPENPQAVGLTVGILRCGIFLRAIGKRIRRNDPR